MKRILLLLLIFFSSNTQAICVLNGNPENPEWHLRNCEIFEYENSKRQLIERRVKAMEEQVQIQREMLKLLKQNNAVTNHGN